VKRLYVGQVDVPTHDEVCAGGSPALQCGGVPAQQVRHVFGARHGHGLVHHHDAQLCSTGAREQPGDAVDLKRTKGVRDISCLLLVEEKSELLRSTGKIGKNRILR
jgi:hypothetical protein